MMAVKSGRAIRFPEEKVRPTGRGAIGVFGISVNSDNDEVVGMICVNVNDPEVSVLVVSSKGYGKRTAVEEYRTTNRGGKGVKTINITEKTGSLIGLLNVNETQDLMITCKSGVTIRTSIASIREAGRATQGVKLIRLDEGDEIAAITNLNEREIEEDIEETDVVDENGILIIKDESASGNEEDVTTNDNSEIANEPENVSDEENEKESNDDSENEPDNETENEPEN
jgi:DNA gyrase subunit A